MPNADVPQWVRTALRARSLGRCERCGTPTPHGHVHHRRSRRVRDVHRHCTCNTVWLCATCHQQVHAEPLPSRLAGWIVSSFNPEPSTEYLVTPWGVRILDCDGGFTVYQPSMTDKESNP